MAYLAGAADPPDIAPPALDPDSADWCDVFPDDPYCQRASIYDDWPEDPGYTLPVEIFNHPFPIPIPVSRPEPLPMPIPAELPPYTPAEPEPAPGSGWSWLVGIGAALVFMLSAKRGKRV